MNTVLLLLGALALAGRGAYVRARGTAMRQVPVPVATRRRPRREPR